MMELITIKKYENCDELINELTREMDGYLLPNHTEHLKPSGGTYLCSGNCKNNYAIRYLGATRGYIEVDDENIIQDIVLYDTAYKNCVKCYFENVKDIIKKYTGAKFLMKI